jgi:hypothetical protein
MDGPLKYDAAGERWTYLPPVADSSNATFSAGGDQVLAYPYSFSLRLLSGQPVAVGTYNVGTGPTDAAFSVNQYPNTCAPPFPGSVDVLEVAQDANGVFQKLALDYTVTCNSHVYTGVLRYNSSIDYVTADEAAIPVDFGSVYDQTTSAQTLTITGMGSEPYVVAGPATLTGSQATSFAITHDGCAGASLSYGQTCTIDLTTKPRGVAVLQALLEIPDNTRAGKRQVPVSVNSIFNAAGKFVVGFGRVLDTRTGLGAPRHPVAGGTAIHIKPLGTGSAATNASAVVLTLTVTGTTTSGFVTAYPTGTTRPNVSSLNFSRGWTGSNLVTVKLGTGGGVDLYVSSGSAQLIADVKGSYEARTNGYAGAVPYHPVIRPFRIMDTRHENGKHIPLPSHYYQELGVQFNQVANSTVKAVAINLTVTGVAATGGYVVAYQGVDTTYLITSTLNPRAHETTAIMTIVPVRTCYSGWCAGANMSTFRIYNGTAHRLDYLVDVVGFYSTTHAAGGTVFHPLSAPTRLVDTRIALGATTFGPAVTQLVNPPSSLAGYNTAALAANVTAVKPTTNTFLTLWPQIPGLTRPGVSNINPMAGRTVANADLLTVGTTEDVNIYNASGRTDVLVDVAGTFENTPELIPPGGSPLAGAASAKEHPARVSYATVGGSRAAPPARS